MKYRLDRTVERFDSALIGGSPLKLFRLTTAGDVIIDRIVAGEHVPRSALVDALLDGGVIHPEPPAMNPRFTAADVTVVVPALGPALDAADGAVIVDDGSDPPLPDATIRLEQNSGPGAARNAGLELVTTPLVAFVDADVTTSDGWMNRLLPHFEDERVALVAPRVTATPAGASSDRLRSYEAVRSPLDLGAEPGRIAAGTRIGYVPAAAIVCRTEAIRRINGFDTTLRYGEDVDLVWRLADAGWRCRYEPTATVEHASRTSWVDWYRQRQAYGTAAAPLARRHPGAVAPARLNPWSGFAWLAVMAGRPALGALTAVGTAAALARKLRWVPARASVRWAIVGTLRSGEQLAQAVRRVWWPVVAIAALRSRTARRIGWCSLLAARHPIAVADDLAYSTGVWIGMLRTRSLDPVIPDLRRWPPRTSISSVGATVVSETAPSRRPPPSGR